jgi:selenoprotein W-related protein
MALRRKPENKRLTLRLNNGQGHPPIPGFPLEDEIANAGPRIEIEYCTKCRWLVRAAWMAQELLGTFEDNLQAVALVPGTEGGIFEVRLAGGGVIWSRRAEGRFPEITELKRLVRDVVAPEKDLGHAEPTD